MAVPWSRLRYSIGCILDLEECSFSEGEPVGDEVGRCLLNHHIEIAYRAIVIASRELNLGNIQSGRFRL